jgi:hypothetical protein
MLFDLVIAKIAQLFSQGRRIQLAPHQPAGCTGDGFARDGDLGKLETQRE